MSKTSKRPGRANRKRRDGDTGNADSTEGRYQVICPQTGTPIFVRDRRKAVEAVLELGTYFFYEMDDKGPMLELPVWVWMIEPDPEDQEAVIAVRHSFAEMKALHDAPTGSRH